MLHLHLYFHFAGSHNNSNMKTLLQHYNFNQIMLNIYIIFIELRMNGDTLACLKV
jgi:hypothetical protein